MLDITVAIPTYNGEKRLPNVLEKLRSQTGTEHFTWEIIVIDNNSNDNTAQVVKKYQTEDNFPYPLKYCFEAKQGLATARQRAISEANSTFVAFLDDDNLPNPNWVAAAYFFGNAHPKAGAYSGQIHANFEVKPPENFQKIEAFLAIREHGSEPHLFEPEKLRLPPGAGLVVRKQAWIENVPLHTVLQGRINGTMIAGDDYEALLYIHKAGWEIWYNPDMHIYHQIPHWRLERNYLLPLCRGCGLATCQLRLINTKNWQKPIVIGRTLLGNLRRVTLHYIKYRKQLQTDLIAACEMEFFLGSLMSPFYIFKLNQTSI